MKRLAKLALWFIKNYADENTKYDVLVKSTSHLFNFVTAEDILRIRDDGNAEFAGKVLDKAYINDIKQQARLFDNMLLWKVLRKDIEYHLCEKEFFASASKQDLVSSKLLRYLVFEVIEKRIRKLKNQ